MKIDIKGVVTPANQYPMVLVNEAGEVAIADSYNTGVILWGDCMGMISDYGDDSDAWVDHGWHPATQPVTITLTN
jgi:hypothetical protein